MRRAYLSWLAIAALLVAGFAASVTALNADVYSAPGFVKSYLDVLGRRDARAALAYPGVLAADTESGTLLTRGAMSGLGDIRLVSDVELTGGEHAVTFDVTLANGTARTEFHVQPSDATLGLFANWSFSESPLGLLAVTTVGTNAFSVNGQRVERDVAAGDGTDTTAPFLVFAPGLYSLDHESTWLEAIDVETRVTEPGAVTDATLTARANATFRTAVQTDVDTALDACAEQDVLQPTSCPFGKRITDRVDGAPDWTIADYPVVTIELGEQVGEWTAIASNGRAHLDATVRSLYDGRETELDENVRFSARYAITIADSGSFTVTAIDD